MKKPAVTILFLSIALCITGRLSAQTGVGVSIGLNAASLTISDPSLQHVSPLAGINASICFTKPLGNSLAFQLGIAWSQHGGLYREETDTPAFKAVEEVTIRGNYFYLPLTLRYYLEVKEGIMGYALLGGYAAARLNGYVSGHIRGDYSLDIDVDLENHSAAGDYGAVLGMGIRVPAGKRILFFEITLARGLANLYRPGDYLRALDLDAKNNMLMVTAGTDNLFVLPF